jgi:general secretion pathway protein A
VGGIGYSRPMYLDTYGLREAPFEGASDPRFVCVFPQPREVMAHLEHTVLTGMPGILVLTGPARVGKTLFVSQLAERLRKEGVRVGLVDAHGHLRSEAEWLHAISQALGLAPSSFTGDNESQLLALSAALIDARARGERPILVVDNAERLGDEALGLLHRLTAQQLATRSPVHVLLVGTPALRELLLHGAALPLSERVVTRFPLVALTIEESEQYIRHRLQVAGMSRMPFSRLGLRALYDYGEGMPGRLNIIARRALERGAASGEASVGERTVERAVREVLPNYFGYWVRRYRNWLIAAAVVLVLAIGALVYLGSGRSPSLPTDLVSVTPAKALEKLRAKLPEPELGKVRVWSELLGRWQVGSSDISVTGAMACNAEIFSGFDCISGHGTLDQLRRFDRPMVLEMEDEGVTHQVLLIGASDTNVRLYVGGSYVELTREAFGELWKGRFFAVFRVDPKMIAPLRRGDQGEGVTWVQTHLAKAADMPRQEVQVGTFDRATEDKVKALQESFGIAADGIVGPETLFALSSLDQDGPHLARNVP